MIKLHTLHELRSLRALLLPIALTCLVSACGEDDNSQASSNASTAAAPQDRSAPIFRDRRNVIPDTPTGNSVDAAAGDQVDIAANADPSVTLNVQTADGGSGNADLSWESTNVDSCKASGSWAGSRPAAGNDSIALNEAGDHTFLLTCDGDQGSAVAMVTVSLEGTEVSWVAPAENTDGSNLTDLAGYNLYYGVASGNYTEVVPVNDASLTSFELPIAPGEYYMAMTAYDFDGNESDLSNEIRQVIN